MAFNFFKKEKNTDSKQSGSDQGRPEEKADSLENDSFSENGSAPSPSPDHSRTANAPETSDTPAASGGFYSRLRKGLAKTRDFLTTDVDQIFLPGKKIDDATLEDLEELLVTSDIGIQPATELIEALTKEKDKITSPEQLKQRLKEKIYAYLENSGPAEMPPQIKPYIIMVVGVNGVGKTTTIGKLAANYTADGKKVMLVAADTFRAAAIEQLSIWADRTGSDIVKHKQNSDPAAVAYDGLEAARSREVDVVLIDTAGRLHTKVNLMEELKKIKRTVAKKIPDAPHEVLLVLDATTGQNALSQAQQFSEAIGVTGLVLTKLDGTAKGGIVVNLCHTMGLALNYIGVGEQINDLQRFDPDRFVDALF